MWNPSWRNPPDQRRTPDNRGPTFRERIPSGCRCSGNYLFPLLSPIRLDRLPLLESMTPRFSLYKIQDREARCQTFPAHEDLGIIVRNGELRKPHISKRAKLMLLPHVRAIFRHDPPAFD